VANESYRQAALWRGGLDPSDVTVVRSGPDPTRMRPGAPVPELRHGREHLCVWLGIMGPQDGVDVLLLSIDHIVHGLGRRDCHFAILGYGDCLDDLRWQCTASGLDEWVTFTGRADAPMIEAYLSTADIGLSSDPLSPLNDVSTMNKTMEYMAFALPVVAYDLRETRVSAGDAAEYVPPGDELAYAAAVVGLLDDPLRCRRMGAIGRERIEHELAWQRQVGGYIAAFDRVTGFERRVDLTQPATTPSPTEERVMEMQT
jgi:glycosyltransferase involved in cell wall biosynthesis